MNNFKKMTGMVLLLLMAAATVYADELTAALGDGEESAPYWEATSRKVPSSPPAAGVG